MLSHCCRQSLLSPSHAVAMMRGTGKRSTGEPPRETDNWGTDLSPMTRLAHRPRNPKGFCRSEMPLAVSLPGVAPDTKLSKFVSSRSWAEGLREARRPQQVWSQDAFWVSLFIPPHRPCQQEVRKTSSLRWLCGRGSSRILRRAFPLPAVASRCVTVGVRSSEVA